MLLFTSWDCSSSSPPRPHQDGEGRPSAFLTGMSGFLSQRAQLGERYGRLLRGCQQTNPLVNYLIRYLLNSDVKVHPPEHYELKRHGVPGSVTRCIYREHRPELLFKSSFLLKSSITANPANSPGPESTHRSKKSIQQPGLSKQTETTYLNMPKKTQTTRG